MTLSRFKVRGQVFARTWKTSRSASPWMIVLFCLGILHYVQRNSRQKQFSRQSRIDISHVCLVQGKRESLFRWVDEMDGSSIFLIFLIYNYNHTYISDDWIAYYEPNSTWTTGRNSLARKAFDLELRRRKTFKYWIFCDEDTQLNCKYGDCWSKLRDLLDALSAPTISVQTTMIINNSLFDNPIPFAPNGSVFQTDSYDAQMNAFNRADIPILLPYVTDGDARSWWLSQAVHCRVMRACFPVSGIMPADFWTPNKQHSAYKRGRYVDLERQLVIDSYSPYGTIPYPMFPIIEPFQQMEILRGPFPLHSVKIKKIDSCKKFTARFESWVRQPCSVRRVSCLSENL